MSLLNLAFYTGFYVLVKLLFYLKEMFGKILGFKSVKVLTLKHQLHFLLVRRADRAKREFIFRLFLAFT